MITKEVFTELSERIVAEVSSVKRVDLFINQLSEPGNWVAINANTVLFAFGEARYEQRSGNCYHVVCPATMYVVEENVRDTELDAAVDDAYLNALGLSVLDLAKSVTSAIVKSGYSNIGRIAVLGSGGINQMQELRYVAVQVDIAYSQGF